MSTASANKPNISWRAAIRGNVLMIGLVSLFTDISSEMINPLLPIFISGLVPLRLAPVFVGIAEGTAEATASLLKLISGRISDKIGQRKSLIVVGYALSTAARPLMALAGIAGAAWAGWQVVGLKFFDRIGKGLRTAPRDALLSDSVSPEIRGLAFSFNRALDHAGAVLGSLSAILILFAFLKYGLWQSTTAKPTAEEMNALRRLFGIALIPGLAALATLIGKVTEIPPRRSAIAAETAAGFTKNWRCLPGSFLMFVAVAALFTLGNSSDMFLLLYAWNRFHMGLASVVGLWILLHLSKIVFSLPGGLLSDRLGRRPTIVAGWLMYAMVYLGLAFARFEWHFWILFFAYGFYYGMSEGSEKALVADLVASEHRGTAFGVYNGVLGLSALPGSLLFGILWSAIGPGWAFGIGSAFAAMASVLLILLLSTQFRRKQP
jgi:MFS family permease